MTFLMHSPELLENNADIFTGPILNMRVLPENDEKTIKVLSLKDVSEEGKVFLNDLREIPIPRKKLPEKYFLRKADIVIKARSSSFAVGIIEKEIDNLVVSSQFIVVRLNEIGKERYEPEYIWIYFNSEFGKRS